ncbi:hypothetical protein RND81_12G027800 [Saponaria officinalis]|uniref:Uncharacterized protein n=1 Tax=Saponaria officinalis TaxID=3572 RepID=A0AAW1H2H7_SAPOF
MQNSMEKTLKISRKRKRSSSISSASINTPFTGVLTRQKSQKFFCSRNRSGKSRQCRLIQRSFAKLPAKKSAQIEVNGDDDDDLSRVSIKDLRARRVFSKPMKKTGVDSDELVDCKVNYFDFGGGNPSISVDEKCDFEVDVGNPSFSILKKCDSNLRAGVLMPSDELNDYGGDLIVEDLAGENPNFVEESENCEPVIDTENPNSIVSKKCDDSEANLSAEGLIDCSEKFSEDMNPNLSDNFVKGGVGENCEVMNEENVQTTPPDAVFSIRKIDEQHRLMSRNLVSRSLNKQISPTKDGSAEVKSSSSLKDMTLNKCSRRKIFKVPNSYTYKRLLPYLMDMAKDEPCTSIDYPSVKIETDVPKSPEKLLAIMPACVPQENSEHISLDNRAATFDSPKTVDETSKEDVSFEHAVDDMEFQTEERLICMRHMSDSVTTPVTSDVPVGGTKKGILKRNPWGCRGICSCLNCTSFRLNADKAFEFSRNQLLEADEVAQELMKELSNLRSMLEKSVTGVSEVRNVAHNQVEEACRRASNVEDMARSHLRQMHEDLFVHSRTKALQRPRVNFSGNVQETVADELAKQNDIVAS